MHRSFQTLGLESDIHQLDHLTEGKTTVQNKELKKVSCFEFEILDTGVQKIMRLLLTGCSDRDLYSCRDGINCIEYRQVCDCVEDCPGGRDERKYITIFST